MPTLSPTAARFQAYLHQSGYDLTVIEFPQGTRTAQEAADRVGCQLGQIVKSLVFRAGESARAVLVLTSGANRVDERRLGALLGEPVERADAEFARQASGYAIGGVPPAGHPVRLTTFLDEDLLAYNAVWAAAGTPNAVFRLTPGQLQALSGARVARVK